MNPRLALLGLFLFAAAVPMPAADMVEIEARFVKATPDEIKNAVKPQVSFEPPIQTPGHMLYMMGILGSEEGTPFPKELLEKVVSNPRIVTLDKERAIIEDVEELRYPSEYSEPGGENGPPAPTAFETKNVGITVEFEPTLGPDGQIDLKVSPRIVTFLGFIDYSGAKPGELPASGVVQELLKKPLKGGGIWQPVFQTRELTTHVTLYPGNTLLLGESLGSADGGEAPSSDEARYYIFVTARKVPHK